MFSFRKWGLAQMFKFLSSETEIFQNELVYIFKFNAKILKTAIRLLRDVWLMGRTLYKI